MPNGRSRLGQTGYILKQSLTEKTLIQEVKNVYEKTAGKEVEQKKTPWRSNRTPGSALSARYRVGVLLTDGRENGAAQEAVVGPDMLVHLLEEIVSRYQMGTLFAPYNRETFILFQLDEELALEERQKTLENWLWLLQNNIGQYLTGKMTIESARSTRNFRRQESSIRMRFLQQNRLFSSGKNGLFL
ncbi:MAG: hypothetical protein ACLR2E_14845 [Lachnospiraceae bacterium]